ncbi:MAG TPA: flagellar hook-length control protein FliK [bacterium]|nr:flagellar hook-length control protein FliK [bacterium]
MSRITDLLNSLNQPTQALGAAQGTRPVSSSPDSSNGQSFGEVVNKLNSQAGNNDAQAPSNNPGTGFNNQPAASDSTAPSAPSNPAPAAGTAQTTLLSEIDIRFTETIKGADSKAQVEQSMTALAGAFQQMAAFLLGNPGVSADQVQNQIVSATQGAVSPDAAKALVAAVQGFLQSLPPSQKSLLADENAGQKLFNQLFQGFAQAAQGKPAPGADGSTTESFDLSMAFGTVTTGFTPAPGAADATTSGQAFFAAGLSAAEFNDNQLQASITNSILDSAPLSQGLADLTQEEGQLLTQGLGASAQGQSATPVTGQDLADLLGRAQAGNVQLTSFSQAAPALSSDQLRQLAQIDFNQVFNNLTQAFPPAAPVVNSQTLEAPLPAQPPVLGAPTQPTIESSILSSPSVVALQSLPALSQLNQTPVNQAGVINRIFEEISASFNAVTVNSPAPISPTAVASAANLSAGAGNPSLGSGQEEQTPVQSNLETAPQLLNSATASGNSDQTQDTQVFQNFLRSSVLIESQTAVVLTSQAQPVAPTAASSATPTANTPAAPTQGVLTPNPAQVPVTPSAAIANPQAPVALAPNNAPPNPVGTTPKETVTATTLFTNTVVMGENVKPVVAQVVAVENQPNLNQALPTDPNLSAVQSINPVLAQGVNSVSTVAEFAALKDQAFKDQDALSGVPVSPSTTADSSSLAGAANFTQTVQANTPSVPNSPINVAGVIQQFAEQISKHSSQEHSVSRISFQLVPENLGRVTIQVALVDQSVSARIVVANPDVKDGLQNHLVDLKAALNQAGLQIDQLQVQVQGGSANLLGQYYQYQQEGASYRLPVGAAVGSLASPENDENTGVLGAFSQRNSLVNLLI